MSSPPRNLKLSAEAQTMFARATLDGRKQILGAVAEFDRRALGEGYACVTVQDLVIGVTYAPETILVDWIIRRAAQPGRAASPRPAPH